jgi:alkylation response protein AidB-like acyl-CoA dehydrogenase
MQMEWSASQRAIRDEYRALGENFARGQQDHLAEGFDWQCWHRLAELGFWRIPLAADVDGAGGDWWDFTAAFEGLSQSIRSTGMLMSVANQASVIRALTLLGTEEQKRRHLGPLLDGGVSATAISERATGTDVRGIETTLSACNGRYRLHGGKVNISHAPTADLILVVAKLHESGRDNTALVLVDRAARGVERSKPCRTLGNDDLPIGDLTFERVEVGEEHLLGRPRQGLRNLMEIASLNRLYFALASAQIITPFLADAMRHAAERRSFDAAIATHQYVQKRLVDIKIGLERTKWLSYAALGQLLSRHEEALMTCSIAKLVGAEDLVNGALDLMRLYGTAGYRDGAISTFTRDALALVSAGGTEEMHRKNIFGQMERLAAGSVAASGRGRAEPPLATAPPARSLAASPAGDR